MTECLPFVKTTSFVCTYLSLFYYKRHDDTHSRGGKTDTKMSNRSSNLNGTIVYDL